METSATLVRVEGPKTEGTGNLQSETQARIHMHIGFEKGRDNKQQVSLC
jgi:hypothetical protein